MRNLFLSFFFAGGFISSMISQTNSTEEGLSKKSPAFYRFNGKLIDLNTLKAADTVKVKNYTEIKKENFYASHFHSDGGERKAEYKNLVFELKENRDVIISDKKGKLIKTISDPDKKILADNITGNAVLFSVSTGVICAIRLQGENGYHIKKYDENGNTIKTWKVAHTIYKKEGGTIESIPFIYYFAHSDNEMIFSSMSYSKPHETIILNLIDGTEKKTNFSMAGIILNRKNNSLAGTINMDENRKILKVELNGKKWQAEDEGYGDAVKTILTDSVLVIAHYHNIATGCSVNAYNPTNGKLIWKGDVKQLMVDHSKYSNVVHLTLYRNKIILEGNEDAGSYLQILDLKTGKRLFELMP